MATMIKKSAASALELTPSGATPSQDTTSDVMTDKPILFSFIDYLCARRGINRDAALELVSNYMIARAAAHAEAKHPITATGPQCTNPVTGTNH
ncbi:MAG TPA: hypothetical protein VHO25_08500 [Polyangiaceae bacterium]|nr:hypothetical protein [Polyangiaceae bacterium]